MFIYKYNAKRDAFAKKLTGWIKNEYLREVLRCFLNFKFCFLEEFIQNYLIEFKNLNAENLTVIVVPEKNAMSGGIYAFFSLATCLKKNFYDDNTEIFIMTRKYPTRETYVRQIHFNTEEVVFRFEQILKFKNVKNLTLHIPEYATRNFYKLISNKTKKYLSQIENIHINIMNQNITFMPEKEEFADLYKITSNVTQTTAHLKYCTQEMADKYNLKTIYFPIPQDFSSSPNKSFSQRKNLIIYSPDNHPQKKLILQKLKQELPEYEVLEIIHMKYEKFVQLASEAKFSISFGEGFDSYYGVPIMKGGLGFAVYNEDFFPNPEYKKYENIFVDEIDMVENIVNKIKRLSSDKIAYENAHKVAYESLSKYMIDSEYFEETLKKFHSGNFDFYPNLDIEIP